MNLHSTLLTAVLLSSAAWPPLIAATLTQAPLELVQSGQARSAIILSPAAAQYCRMAADELRTHVRRASGAEIPVVSPDALATLAPGTVRILIGSDRNLRPEEYSIRTSDNQLIFAGAEEPPGRSAKAETSIAVVWAVERFLDTQLGVRWLWPGELGTYVPSLKTIYLAPLEIHSRPALESRKLRHYKAAEMETWGVRHMLGDRTAYRFGHQYGDWWEKYGKTHPEYFAMDPKGKRGTFEPRERMKECISNPAVGDLILNQWRAEGRPDVWTVCPTDSGGFCTCPACRAMDDPDQRQFPAEAIWRERGVNLTRRYLTFWNGLIERMRQENPRIALCGYAYSVYRQPPTHLKVAKGLALAFVPKSYDPRFWDGWRGAGAEVLFLRPNWWHIGAPAPYLPIHAQGNYFKHAEQNGLVGFDFDTLMGFWGTQGPLYYMVARLSSRPDLTVDDVIGEYCSAFGEAAPAIKEYLDYWERYSDETAYAPSHNESSAFPGKGRYLDASLRRKLNPERAPEVSWRVLSDLYPDPVIDRGESILTRAETMARMPLEKQRVAFLEDGLRFLRVCRDFMQKPDQFARLVGNLHGIDPHIYDLPTLKNVMLVKPHLIKGAAIDANE
jgi:hypothetical protein